MKVVILAGGFGTRLSEYTDRIPKPMVEIGGKPILIHIMEIYSQYGYTEFIIALGYKGNYIKDYFLKYYSVTNDFRLNLRTGKIRYINEKNGNWDITLVDTGEKSMTGGRVKRLQQLIGNEPFMLTYGDAVADINIKELVNFHKNHSKIGTVTAVHPPARFGEITININSSVTSFKEKPQMKQGWINGGFFIFQPEFIDYIEGDLTVLEKEPLETISIKNELFAFKHEGFWQCMDTVRDLNLLEQICESGSIPWLVKK